MWSGILSKPTNSVKLEVLWDTEISCFYEVLLLSSFSSSMRKNEICLENTLEDGEKSDMWKVGESYLNQANFQKIRMNKVLRGRSYLEWIAFSSLHCPENALSTNTEINSSVTLMVFSEFIRNFVFQKLVKSKYSFICINTLFMGNKIWK